MMIRRQSGQAAVEALISALALAVLWAGVAWLGRIQDVALQASHAARYAAFVGARDDTLIPDSQVHPGLFTGTGNQWSDRRGEALLSSVYRTIDVTLIRGKPVGLDAQAGGSDPNTMTLRDDWNFADTGVLSAKLSLIPYRPDAHRASNRSLLQLEQFDSAYPRITRHVSILTGAGHASSDHLTTERIKKSGLGWSDSVTDSSRLGRKVQSVASKVDAGWRRPEPEFDWLTPWEDYIPEHHLRPLP